MIRELKIRVGLIILAMMNPYPSLWAQAPNVPTTVEKPKELQDTPKNVLDAMKEEREDNSFEDTRDRHYLTLTIGLEHEESGIQLPEGFKVQGDYEKIASYTYEPTGGILRINPQSIGIGTLTLHDKTGKLLHEFRIDIKKSALDKIARELKSLIGDIEGIQIRIINNKVIVDGQILLPRDVSRIGNAVLQFGDQAVSLVSLSPLAQKKIAEIIQREIASEEVTVRAVNEKFILEGTVDSEDDRERAKKIANIYLPATVLDPAEEKFIKRRANKDPIVDMLRVRPPAPRGAEKIIQIVIQYVELNKDYNRMFRFQWMPDLKDGSSMSFGGANTEPGLFSQISGIVSNLFPKLNWMKAHNFARVVNTKTFIVENGQKGDFDVSQKFPYSVINANGQAGTQFEAVGTVGSVTPTIISQGSESVRLDIRYAVSELVGVTGSGPITNQNKFGTVVTVRSGQSAALNGSIKNSNFTDYNRLPSDASQNPIISLYASKGFQRKQSQDILFITPIIKSSAEEGAEKIKKKFRVRD